MPGPQYGPLARILRGQRILCARQASSLAHNSIFSHASCAPLLHQRRLAQTVAATQALVPTNKVNNSAGSFTKHESLLLQPVSNQDDPKAWIKLIEPYLPVHLRTPATNEFEYIPTSEYSFANLTRTIILARTAAQIDIVSYLGLEQGRWDVVLWITKTLLETSPSPRFGSVQSTYLSNINWPSTSSLEKLTANSFILDYRAMDELGSRQPLTGFTTSKESTWKSMSESRGKAALGQVWQTVANLIIAAAARDAESTHNIMSYVLRILADLHHRGWIPNDVYQYHLNDDPSSPQQPPLLRALSTKILSALSDAVFEGQEIHPPSSSADSQRDASHELSPGLWMEFVLWCCVHGSWLMEGSSIINVMRKQRGQQSWSLMQGRDILQLQNTNQDWTGLEKTISAEVVIALVDGLMSSLANPRDLLNGSTIVQVLERLRWLKLVLEKDNMSLGASTWDTMIARFAELPAFEVDNNPRLMQTALEFAELYGRSINATNAPLDSDHATPLPTYVLDPSAVVLGLYHRTLNAYIKSRDITGALTLLSHLLRLTEKNQNRSLHEFFTQMPQYHSSPFTKVKQGTAGKHSVDYTSIFPGVQYPGFYPDVPIQVLADLLDLITDFGPIEVGRWMIHSQDPDGPLISEAMYGNQVIAPALIRFAAVTSDAALLGKLVRTQTSRISAQTLVALCDGRIREGSWQGATDVLSLIRDHALHSWTADDFGILLRPLVAKCLEGTNARSREPASAEASLLIQKLLRGDLGQVWGPRFSQLDSIAGVLFTVSPLMASICSGTLIGGRQYALDISNVTFDLLLQGTLDALGSSAGRNLWEKWCTGTEFDRVVELPESSAIERTNHRVSAHQTFFGQESPVNEGEPLGSKTALFKGRILKRIETFRLIVRQALQEHRKLATLNGEKNAANDASGQLQKAQGQKHEVLDWAANVLREEFDMSNADMEYELEGYLTSQSLSPPTQMSYSAQTLSIWRVFSGSRKQWVLIREARLREFVQNSVDKQIIFEHVPPAERYFLHCLAADFGLVSESFGEEAERATKISKTAYTPPLLSRTVEEVARRG